MLYQFYLALFALTVAVINRAYTNREQNSTLRIDTGVPKIIVHFYGDPVAYVVPSFPTITLFRPKSG